MSEAARTQARWEALAAIQRTLDNYADAWAAEQTAALRAELAMLLREHRCRRCGGVEPPTEVRVSHLWPRAMSDAARAKAREIMQTLGLPVFRDSVESREAWLIETLDAYAAEQTADLRALVKRQQDHMLDAVVTFGLEKTKWDEVRCALLAAPEAAP